MGHLKNENLYKNISETFCTSMFLGYCFHLFWFLAKKTERNFKSRWNKPRAGKLTRLLISSLHPLKITVSAWITLDRRKITQVNLYYLFLETFSASMESWSSEKIQWITGIETRWYLSTISSQRPTVRNVCQLYTTAQEFS